MSEAAKHTPGPWEIWSTLHGWTICSPSDGWSVTSLPDSDPIHHANAHLIAAAPEMLAVLKDALDMAELAETLTGCRGDDDFVAEFKAKVEAAISKAEGPRP